MALFLQFISEFGLAIVGAVGGATAGLLISAIRKIRLFDPMRGRQNSLTGTWHGEATQTSSTGEILNYEVRLDLKAGKRQIKGTGRIEGKIDGEIVVQQLDIFTGGFMFDQFLKLEYKNEDEGTRQFGTIIGQLDPLGSTIHATYAGYGAVMGEPATGRIQFKKS